MIRRWFGHRGVIHRWRVRHALDRANRPRVTRDRRIVVEGCRVAMKPGWYCTRPYHRDGPCALVPRWWNLSGLARWTRSHHG